MCPEVLFKVLHISQLPAFYRSGLFQFSLEYDLLIWDGSTVISPLQNISLRLFILYILSFSQLFELLSLSIHHSFYNDHCTSALVMIFHLGLVQHSFCFILSQSSFLALDSSYIPKLTRTLCTFPLTCVP